MSVDGQSIPLNTPDCRKCARFVVCDIFKAQSKFQNEVYPLIAEDGNPEKPAPENKQPRPFPPTKLAIICKHYASATMKDPLTA